MSVHAGRHPGTPRLRAMGGLAALFAVLASIVAAMVLGASSASASTPHPHAPRSSTSSTILADAPTSMPLSLTPICQGDSYCGNYNANGNVAPSCNSHSSAVDANRARADSSDLLAINRWGGAASTLHTTLGAKFTDDIGAKVSRNFFDTTLLSFGNTMWQISTNMTVSATRFCLLDTVGTQIDQGSARIGGALFHSPILAALLAASILYSLWKLARGTGDTRELMRRLGTACLVLALFTIMVAGASQTTSLGNGSTQFGSGSPGWFATKINNTISGLASVPAMTMIDPSTLSGASADTTNTGPLSCGAYREQLYKMYARSFGNDTAGKSVASMSQVMSAMWETTGMKAWSNVQFGSANTYADYSNCRLLDHESSGVKQGAASDPAGADTSIGITKATMTGAQLARYPINTDALVWEYGDRSWDVDINQVGWTACRPAGLGVGAASKGWQIVDPAWSAFLSHATDRSSDHGGPESACNSWWSTPHSNFGGTGCSDGECSSLSWPDDSSLITNAARKGTAAGVGGMAPIENFMLNFHGNSNGGAASVAIVYLISSFLMMIIFAGMALAVMLAKCVSTVMILITFIVLLLALVPGRAEDSKILSFFKTYAGMSLFVFALQVIFAIVVVVTSFLVQAGTQSFGAGSFGATLWTGFAPVIAVVVLHMIFTHALKVPSPFKVSGALAWGAAAGGMGAAAGVGIDRMVTRAGRRARREAGQGARGMGSKITGATPMGRAAQAKKAKRRLAPGAMGAMEPSNKTGAANATAADANGKGAADGAAPVVAGVGAGKGKAAARQRLADSQERREAKKHAKDVRPGFRERVAEAAKKTASAVRDPRTSLRNLGRGVGGTTAAMRANAAWNNMRTHPFRALAKGAAVVGAAVVTSPVAVGAVAAAMAARKARQSHEARRTRRDKGGGMAPEERVRRRERRTREQVEAYRRDKAKLEAAAAKERRRPRPTPQGSPSGPGTGTGSSPKPKGASQNGAAAPSPPDRGRRTTERHSGDRVAF